MAEQSTEVGDQLDRGGRGLLGERGEALLAQGVADQPVARAHRRRARPGIQDRELAEHGSLREGDEAHVAAVRMPQERARRAAGDDEHLVARLALAEYLAPRLVLAALEVLLDRRQLGGGEAFGD